VPAHACQRAGADASRHLMIFAVAGELDRARQVQRTGCAGRTILAQLRTYTRSSAQTLLVASPLRMLVDTSC